MNLEKVHSWGKKLKVTSERHALKKHFVRLIADFFLPCDRRTPLLIKVKNRMGDFRL